MDSAYNAVVALLRERGATDIEHPGGTLLAHLVRVAERLYQDTGDEVVRLAALSHAVYGTDGFDTSLLSLEERSVLADLTGPDVEGLVYLYAACDRGKTWATLGETKAVHDRWTGQVTQPDAALLRRFVDLSIVNEVDVCEQSAEMMAKYGRPLLTRFRTWQALGSEPVLRDAENVLGGAS